ncbi:hypothetical protein AVEN_140584-1 [Araneus ventricosus]|uniref:Uncharacterized protein n=1 Tax=Araneus ventricosus TaxID=182803 RepID=A0A4Y2GRY6_ARAVE|nr:hypothetical protein AVEN_140584-1 [Araneus ventricosus]
MMSTIGQLREGKAVLSSIKGTAERQSEFRFILSRTPQKFQNDKTSMNKIILSEKNLPKEANKRNGKVDEPPHPGPSSN